MNIRAALVLIVITVVLGNTLEPLHRELPDGAARPLALVYRGPAACEGCAEALADVMENGQLHTLFDVQFVGPDEDHQVSAKTLSTAQIYLQPGGGTVKKAWPHVRDSAVAIREWVDAGGTYIGFCLGAYLAGADYFGVYRGTVDRYISAPMAVVDHSQPTVTRIVWSGEDRWMYFQDGPAFSSLPRGSRVLARYASGEAAAAISPYGDGSVAVIGPHPEATHSWYPPRLHPYEEPTTDLAADFINQTLQ